MPSTIDIRRRIRSVKNTQQITKAMKMVAAAKLRRAQERMMSARPYAAALRQVLASVASRVDVTKHPLLQEREQENKVLLLVVTAFIIASAILPLADRLEKRGVSRTGTVAGVFALILVGVGSLAVLTAPILGEQLHQLTTHAPQQIGRLTAWVTARSCGVAAAGTLSARQSRLLLVGQGAGP